MLKSTPDTNEARPVTRREFIGLLFGTTIAAGVALTPWGEIFNGKALRSSPSSQTGQQEIGTQSTRDVLLGLNHQMSYACLSESGQQALTGTIEFLGVESDLSPIFAADQTTRLLSDQGTFQPRAAIGPGNDIVVKSMNLPTEWKIGVVSRVISPPGENSSGPSVLLQMNLEPTTQNTSPNGMNRLAIENPPSSRKG